ncbi:hypothetical protein OJAV_G00043360 [Oryzias javanicus]|uniref:Ig-like domain-containing protein n=1 Tax=Oryzias javanicus TaxID=123683 RepID=A0A3S2N360_ORYJA|nr:hypothetical protein OJAV_G00043360 [Oryzias javanicus]
MLLCFLSVAADGIWHSVADELRPPYGCRDNHNRAEDPGQPKGEGDMLGRGVYVALTLVLFLLLWQEAGLIEVPLDPKIQQNMKQPPTIIKQSVKDYIVDPRDNIIIECEAKGNPIPTFSWKRNGKFFNIGSNPRVTMRKRSGTLEIGIRPGERPEDYEGNTSALPERPRNGYVQQDPTAGLQGSSVAQGGLPPPQIFWIDSNMNPIPQNERVSMGQNGDLYFSNVLVQDAERDYSCNARFNFTQTIQQKNPFTLRVQTTEPYNDTSFNATDPYGGRKVAESRPTFLTPSGIQSSKMVLRDKELLLECIAAGLPTPSITWFKKGQSFQHGR